MDKRILKEFSIMARNELRSQVTRMANSFGVFEDRNGRIESGNDYVIINGKTYTKAYEASYNKLIEVKEEKGFEELIEEVAYTWFNRFIALRFMEVNDYLPSHIRVLSSEIKGKVDPDILEHYEEADLDINIDEIYKLINVDKNIELAYRKLLIAQCNKLSTLMPFLFEKINDYTEMLLPDKLLIPESIISKLVSTISEADFKEEVEIIGWIYQYYISEKKDKVYADLKKNIKISKENIPAATQLFTPKWIVKYMVENSLGRLWLEGHPNDELQKQWEYYLEEAEQEAEVQEELQKIREEHAKLTPEDIKILDPCMGSGHILVYAFDVLYEIYKTAGYSSREIPKLILKNNLYGLDIDDRAAQLASFALIMKARQYNKRIFKQIEDEEIELNLCSIQESNGISEEAIEYFANGKQDLRQDLESLIELFINAKEYGSLIEVKPINLLQITQRINEIKSVFDLKFGDLKNEILQSIPKLILQYNVINSSYEVCITNPPYMTISNANIVLYDFVKINFNNFKNDLYSVFLKRCDQYIKENYYYALITPHSWMTLSAFEPVREYLLSNNTLINMAHLGVGAFGADFGTTSYVIRKGIQNQYKALFKRLVNETGLEAKEVIFLSNANIYSTIMQYKFTELPMKAISYWMNENLINIFMKKIYIDRILTSREGLTTGCNDIFLRFWHEVVSESISFHNNSKKWFPYNKGGEYKRWYGNNYHVVNWQDDGIQIRNFKDEITGRVRSHNYNDDFILKEGITWSAFSSSGVSFRYSSKGFLFDSKGSMAFVNKMNIYSILGYLNSVVGKYFLGFIGVTRDTKPGHVRMLPFNNQIDHFDTEGIVKSLCKLSKQDWDNYEISWDFKSHPFIHGTKINKLSEIYLNWDLKCKGNIGDYKRYEEELNKIFIKIFELEDELTYQINDKDITISSADREKDIKSLISYAVGCMFGRYSIDVDGLIYAGGDFSDKWNIEEKKVRKIEKDDDGNILSDTWVDATFMPDMDNTIPVTENEYFDDDIVSRFVEFIKIVYGEDTLEENLDFIADTLVKKNNETSRGRIRRYFVDEFYKDHCKIYQSRPIYWMIDSGKNKGFKALIYLHRYNKETLSNVRLSYLLELQGKYLNEQKQIERYLDSSSISNIEKKKRNKELQILSQKQAEILAFDKVLDEFANKQIELDLDDGVVVNYGKLQQVLAKIK